MRLMCLSVALILASTGCGGGGVTTVEGKVTLDGAPLAEGDIVFAPVDANLGAEGGKITAGRYSLKAKAGKNKVEIRSVQVIPGKTMPSAAGPGAPPEPVKENIIPAKYNASTELQADVGSKTSFDFELKSK